MKRDIHLTADSEFLDILHKKGLNISKICNDAIQNAATEEKENKDMAIIMKADEKADLLTRICEYAKKDYKLYRRSNELAAIYEYETTKNWRATKEQRHLIRLRRIIEIIETTIAKRAKEGKPLYEGNTSYPDYEKEAPPAPPEEKEAEPQNI